MEIANGKKGLWIVGVLVGILALTLGFLTWEIFCACRGNPLPFWDSAVGKNLVTTETLNSSESATSMKTLEQESISVLQARLLGTLIEKSPEGSRAFIHDLLKHQVVSLRIGEFLQGRALTQIERGLVRFHRSDGKEEVLSMGEFSDASSIIQELQPGSYRVDRQGLARAIEGDVSTFIANAEPQPQFQQFQLIGVKLKKVDEQSLLEKAGFRSEDIITAINGKPMNSVQAGLKIYDEVRHNQEFSVEVMRGDQLHTLRYKLE